MSEIPYQVNKGILIKRIAELIKNKKIEGISNLRDESDKDGMRIVIEIKKNENTEIILNNLYSQTNMQTIFSINMVALVKNKPKLLTLKRIIEEFIKHRKEIVTRRTIYDLKKKRKKAHILEGLVNALFNISTVISIIKKSKNLNDAKKNLIKFNWKKNLLKKKIIKKNSKKYNLSEKQINAILELKLNKLTNLELNKIINEYKEIYKKIKNLILILKDIENLLTTICIELKEIKKIFSDKRRSEIVSLENDLNYENLITKKNMVVTLSYDGYIKSQPLNYYNAQKRGGRGKSSTQIKSEDFIYKLEIASNHNTMLCFSSSGKVYWKKVYKLPQSSRATKGKPINNIIPLKRKEKITTMLSISEYKKNYHIFMVTKLGIVKKVHLDSFSRPRKNGIYALTLDKNDELLHVALTSGDQEIMIFSNRGKAIRFDESNIRTMGRNARGIIGMKLQNNQHIVGIIVSKPNKGMVLTATENGYGKRTKISEYRKTTRGSQGVISISISKRNGLVVSANLVKNHNNIMLMTDQGTLIRTRVNEIRETSRSAQGVKLINLKKGEKLISVQVIIEKNLKIK